MKIILTGLLCIAFSYQITFGQQSFSQQEIMFLKKEIERIGEKDQRYRSVITLGTFDPHTIGLGKAMRDTASIGNYIAFLKTVNKDITEKQKDSLWNLQHQLDFENFQSFKAIVNEYGYPSNERLKLDADGLYAILLHPPVELDVKEYQTEMMKLLIPEVKLGNMAPESLAAFYDNMQTKILNLPQLYGTVKSFDMQTMKPGKPKISDVVKSNRARREIGMEPLQEDEYVLIDN